MKCVGWKAWYSGGHKYSAATTTWAELPETGVLLIQLYFDKRGKNSRLPYRQTYSSDDYFWLKGDDMGALSQAVVGSCRHEEMTPEKIVEKYPGAIIKRGIWVSGEEFDAAMQDAAKDRFFP